MRITPEASDPSSGDGARSGRKLAWALPTAQADAETDAIKAHIRDLEAPPSPPSALLAPGGLPGALSSPSSLPPASPGFPISPFHGSAAKDGTDSTTASNGGAGWALLRKHHAATSLSTRQRGATTAVLAVSTMAASMRRRQGRQYGTVGGGGGGGGGSGAGGGMGRRGMRVRQQEPTVRLQEKVWRALRDAKETPGMRGWVFRRGVPMVGATLFCWDVISDAVLAKNLFKNGYPKVGMLTMVFMFAHYLPTYIMLLRAANQSFFTQHFMLLSAAASAASDPSAAASAAAAGASGGSSALSAAARMLESLHFFFYVLLVVFGLPLLPFLDLYMVLTAVVLTTDRGDAGYVMRTAEDFCRQYERVRLPLECFLESLPQTALQVYLYIQTRSGSAAEAVQVSQNVLTVSLLGSVLNFINVSWEMYNAWRASGDTLLEYLDALIRLQGSTKVPIEAQNAMLERIADHQRRVLDHDKAAHAAHMSRKAARRGGADCKEEGRSDEGEDAASDSDEAHKRVLEGSRSYSSEESKRRNARMYGVPPSLVFTVGGPGDTVYQALSAFQRRSLMDVLAMPSKLQMYSLRAVQMLNVDPSVAARLLRRVSTLPPHLHIVGAWQGRRSAAATASAGSAGSGAGQLNPSYLNLICKVLPDAAFETDPLTPLIDLHLSRLALTGYYSASGASSSSAGGSAAADASARVGRALAQVLDFQPSLRRLVVDHCDVFVPLMLEALDAEVQELYHLGGVHGGLQESAYGSVTVVAGGTAGGDGGKGGGVAAVLAAEEAAFEARRARMSGGRGGGGGGHGGDVITGPRLLVVLHTEGGPELESWLEERARNAGSVAAVTAAAAAAGATPMGLTSAPSGTLRSTVAAGGGVVGGGAAVEPLRELHLIPNYRPRAISPDSKVILVPCPRAVGLLDLLSAGLSSLLVPPRLPLNNTELRSEDAAAIGACLVFNRSIEALDMRSTGLSADSLLHMVPGLQAHSSLTSIDLSSNNIGDVGVEGLMSAVVHLPALSTLVLARCGMGARGADALGGQLLATGAHTRIAELDLQDNKEDCATPVLEWVSFLHQKRTGKQAKAPTSHRMELGENGPVIPLFGSTGDVISACRDVLTKDPAAPADSSSGASSSSPATVEPTTLELPSSGGHDHSSLVIIAITAANSHCPLSLDLSNWSQYTHPAVGPMQLLGFNHARGSSAFLAAVVGGLLGTDAAHVQHLDLTATPLAAPSGVAATGAAGAGGGGGVGGGGNAAAAGAAAMYLSPVEHLCMGVAKNTHLRALKLARCDLDDDAVVALCAALIAGGCPSLERLELVQNPRIRDRGFLKGIMPLLQAAAGGSDSAWAEARAKAWQEREAAAKDRERRRAPLLVVTADAHDGDEALKKETVLELLAAASAGWRPMGRAGSAGKTPSQPGSVNAGRSVLRLTVSDAGVDQVLSALAEEAVLGTPNGAAAADGAITRNCEGTGLDVRIRLEANSHAVSMAMVLCQLPEASSPSPASPSVVGAAPKPQPTPPNPSKPAAAASQADANPPDSATATDAVAAALTCVSGLDMADSKIQPLGISALAIALKRPALISSLRSLNMVSCGLGNAEVLELCAALKAGGCPVLERLELQNNPGIRSRGLLDGVLPLLQTVADATKAAAVAAANGVAQEEPKQQQWAQQWAQQEQGRLVRRLSAAATAQASEAVLAAKQKRQVKPGLQVTLGVGSVAAMHGSEKDAEFQDVEYEVETVTAVLEAVLKLSGGKTRSSSSSGSGTAAASNAGEEGKTGGDAKGGDGSADTKGDGVADRDVPVDVVTGGSGDQASREIVPGLNTAKRGGVGNSSGGDGAAEGTASTKGSSDAVSHSSARRLLLPPPPKLLLITSSSKFDQVLTSILAPPPPPPPSSAALRARHSKGRHSSQARTASEKSRSKGRLQKSTEADDRGKGKEKTELADSSSATAAVSKPSGAPAAAAAPPSPPSSITLRLGANDTDGQTRQSSTQLEAIALATALCQQHPRSAALLRTLDLSESSRGLGSAGLAALAFVLRHAACAVHLEELLLVGLVDGVGDALADMLAAAVPSLPYIRRLDLAGSSHLLGVDAAERLIRALQQQQTAAVAAQDAETEMEGGDGCDDAVDDDDEEVDELRLSDYERGEGDGDGASSDEGTPAEEEEEEEEEEGGAAAEGGNTGAGEGYKASENANLQQQHPQQLDGQQPLPVVRQFRMGPLQPSATVIRALADLCLRVEQGWWPQLQQPQLALPPPSPQQQQQARHQQQQQPTTKAAVPLPSTSKRRYPYRTLIACNQRWTCSLVAGTHGTDSLCSAIASMSTPQQQQQTSGQSGTALNVSPGVKPGVMTPQHTMALSWALCQASISLGAAVGSGAATLAQKKAPMVALLTHSLTPAAVSAAAAALAAAPSHAVVGRSSSVTGAATAAIIAAAAAAATSAAPAGANTAAAVTGGDAAAVVLLAACEICRRGVNLGKRDGAVAVTEKEKEGEPAMAGSSPLRSSSSARSPAELPVLLATAAAATEEKAGSELQLPEVAVDVRALGDTDAAALALALLPGRLGTKGHKLDFGGCRLTTEGLRALLQLLSLHGSSLTQLGLTGQSTIAEVSELQDLLCRTTLPALTTLQRLELVGCPVSPGPLGEALHGLSSLKCVVVTDNAEVKALKETGRLPPGSKCVPRTSEGIHTVGLKMMDLKFEMTTVTISPCGAKLYVCSKANDTHVFDYNTGEKYMKFKCIEDTGYNMLCLAASRDGKMLASGTKNGQIVVFDSGSGDVIARLSGHAKLVNCVVFTNDCKRLVSCSYDKTLKVFDLETQAVLATLGGHNDEVNYVALSPDGTRIASCADDGEILVHNLYNLKLTNPVTTLHHKTARLNRVAWRPDGAQIAATCNDKTIQLFNVESGKCTAVLKGHTGDVTRVGYHPSGSLLASGCTEGRLHLWSVEAAACVAVLPPVPGINTSSSIRATEFTADGSVLVTGSASSIMKWSTTALLQMVARLEDGHAVLAVTSGDAGDGSGAGVTAAVKAASDAAKERSISAGPLGYLEANLAGGSGTCEALWPAHEEALYEVVAAKDGRAVVTAGKDRLARFYDLSKPLAGTLTLSGEDVPVNSVALSPDASFCVTGGDNGTVVLHDLPSGFIRMKLPGYPSQSSIVTVAISPDGRYVASSGRNIAGAVVVHDLQVPDPGKADPEKLEAHKDSVWSVTFAPDGSGRLASCSEDRTVQIWDVPGKTQVATLTLASPVGRVAYTPDAVRLAAMTDARLICIYDTSTHQCLMEIPIHPTYGKFSRYHSFSPDGRFLAGVTTGVYPGTTNACSDQTVRIWDAVTGEPLVAVPHPDQLTGVAFGQDILATACIDGKARVYSLDRLMASVEEDSVSGGGAAAGATAAGGGGVGVQDGGSGNGAAGALAPKSTKQFWSVQLPMKVSVDAPLADLRSAHDDVVWSLAFSPNGQRLLSTSRDGTVRLFSTATWECMATLHYSRYEQGGAAGASSAVGAAEAAAGDDGKVGPAEGDGEGEGANLDAYNIAAIWSPDGRMVASSSGTEHVVRLWVLNPAGSQYYVLKGHQQQVLTLCFSPDSRTLASGGVGEGIVLHDLQGLIPPSTATGISTTSQAGTSSAPSSSAGAAQQPQQPPSGRAATTAAAAVRGQGKAVAGVLEPVKVLMFEELKATVWSLLFHPTDSNLLAYLAADGTVALHSIISPGSATMLQTPEFAGAAVGMRFSPSGSQLAVCDSESNAYLYSTEDGSCKTILPAVATSKDPWFQPRTLTPSELDPERVGSAARLLDKYTVTYPGGDSDVGAVQANRCVPAQSVIYYYEVKILDKGDGGTIAIGYADKTYPLSSQPGWRSRSCAFHGDDGNVFNNGASSSYGPRFSEESGAVVGAALNMLSGEIFFTVNGQRFQPMPFPAAGLYPTIGLHSTGETVEVNFGQKPFMYDIAADVAAAVKAKRKMCDRAVPVTTDIAKKGLIVTRGPDWKWDMQDGGAGKTGRLTEASSSGWWSVKWENGGEYNYRVGAEGRYDLQTAAGGIGYLVPKLLTLSGKLRLGEKVTRESAKEGMIVTRGDDWKWGDQDGGEGKKGKITQVKSDNWARVEWEESKSSNNYRIGADGCYDLREVVSLETPLKETPLEDSAELLPPRMGRVLFSPSGDYLATAGADKSVLIWRLDGVGDEVRGSVVGTLNDFKSPVLGLDISPSGRYIAASAVSNSITVYSCDCLMPN